MLPKRKKWWVEYLESLSVAFLFAIVFGLIMHGTVLQTLVNTVLSGFVFGTLFFVAGYFLPKAKFRSFWLTCLVRSLVVWLIISIGMSFVVPFAIGMDFRKPPWDPDVLHAFVRFELSPSGFFWGSIGLFLSFAINGFYQVNR